MANEDLIEVVYDRKLGVARGAVKGRFAISLTMAMILISLSAVAIYWSSHA